MITIFLLFLIFWLVVQIKSGLFWLYLWQLKEYHLKRFLDHFRTYKGKKIFVNPFFGVKIMLFAFLLSGLFQESPCFRGAIGTVGFWLALFLFFVEASKTFKDSLRKTLKRPVFTKKIIFLNFGFLLLVFVFGIFAFWKFQYDLMFFTVSLLLFNVFIFFFIGLLISLFWPVTSIYQKKLLRRAQRKREKLKDLIVIGITGSYGKTSTKEFLAKILSEKYRVLKTKKHINAEIGIARTILNELREGHQVFVAEIGAYERGKIKQVCKILQPRIGILTGINEQHMATFGSQENIIRAKFELIEALPEDGMAVMNWDNKFIKSKVKSQKSKLQVKSQKFYSIRDKLDIWAENIKVEKESISFKAVAKDGDSAFFEVNLIGAYNISNILAAALVAHYKFGFSLSEIAKACGAFGSEMGAMALKKSRGGLNIIESTYSANPDGVISALDYLKVWQGVKRIIVMPCLIELGQSSKKVHRRLGRKIAEICDLAIITTKDRFKQIKAGAVAVGMKEENILFIESPKAIVRQTKKASKPGDVILLEGRVPRGVIELLNN